MQGSKSDEMCAVEAQGTSDFSVVGVQFLICKVMNSSLSRATHMDVLVLAAVMNQRLMLKPISE